MSDIYRRLLRKPDGSVDYESEAAQWCQRDSAMLHLPPFQRHGLVAFVRAKQLNRLTDFAGNWYEDDYGATSCNFFTYDDLVILRTESRRIHSSDRSLWQRITQTAGEILRQIPHHDDSEIRVEIGDSGRTAKEWGALYYATAKWMQHRKYLELGYWKWLRAMKLSAYPECELCGQDLGSLHVHHVCYEHKPFETLDCLKTLCEQCHGHFHIGRKVVKKQ